VLGLVVPPRRSPTLGRDRFSGRRCLHFVGVRPGQSFLVAETAAVLPALGRAMAAAHVVLTRKRPAAVLVGEGGDRQAEGRGQVGNDGDTRTQPVFRWTPGTLPTARAHSGAGHVARGYFTFVLSLCCADRKVEQRPFSFSRFLSLD